MTGTLSHLHYIYKVEKVQKTRSDYSLVSCSRNSHSLDLQLPEIVRLEDNQGCSKAIDRFKEYFRIKNTSKWKDSKQVTGLFPTQHTNVFYGDMDKRKHFILFKLTPERDALHVVLFPNYYPFKKEDREQLIMSVIKKGNI